MAEYEGEKMQVEKPSLNLNFNIPTLIAIGGLLITGVTGWNKLDSRIEAVENFRQTRVTFTDQNFANINAKLGELQTIPYRVGQAEARLDETSKRIDRLSETIINSLDTIRKEVSTLSTRVEVLSGKIDGLSAREQAQRTSVGRQP